MVVGSVAEGMANLDLYLPGEVLFTMLSDGGAIQAWRVDDDGRPQPLPTGDLRPGRSEEWGD